MMSKKDNLLYSFDLVIDMTKSPNNGQLSSALRSQAYESWSQHGHSVPPFDSLIDVTSDRRRTVLFDL